MGLKILSPLAAAEPDLMASFEPMDLAVADSRAKQEYQRWLAILARGPNL
jgi:hypothetical protein